MGDIKNNDLQDVAQANALNDLSSLKEMISSAQGIIGLFITSEPRHKQHLSTETSDLITAAEDLSKNLETQSLSDADTNSARKELEGIIEISNSTQAILKNINFNLEGTVQLAGKTLTDTDHKVEMIKKCAEETLRRLQRERTFLASGN